MHELLLDMLQCPACADPLRWEIETRVAARILEAVARCSSCGAAYPVHEGIGVFLTPDLERRDLWQEVESGLARYLRENPAAERRLMVAPLTDLNAADLLLRSMVLEERGAFVEAEKARETARVSLYTAEYSACSDRQLSYVAEHVPGDGPIVDLASGRGTLAERLVRQRGGPVVLTDFSVSVLLRNRRRLAFEGLADAVTLLAVDARRTPFRDGSIETLTSYVGLPNVAEADRVPGELRRIVAGSFFAVLHFYPEEDPANAAAAEKLGLAPFLYRTSTLERLRSAGWSVAVENSCSGRAAPTAISEVIEGMGVDTLPVVETTLEWVTMVAR